MRGRESIIQIKTWYAFVLCMAIEPGTEGRFLLAVPMVAVIIRIRMRVENKQ